MVQQQQTRAVNRNLPPSGSSILVAGDSIQDWGNDGYSGGNALNSGKSTVKLCSQYGWRLLAANGILNGSFETDTTGWVAAAGCSISSDATHASQGSRSMKVTATATGNTWFNPVGDLGAVRLSLQEGVAYAAALDVFIPTGVTGTITLQIFDKVSGTYASSNSVAVSASNTWQRISVSRTIGVGSTEIFVRVLWTGATSGQAIWIDAVMLEPGTTANAFCDTLDTLRPAVSGSLLQTTDSTLNNFLGNVATRFSQWVTNPVPAMIVLHMGTNDFAQVTNTTNKTRTTWRDALASAMRLFESLNPTPLIVVIGLGSLSTYNDATAVSQWGTGWQRQHVYTDMNNITQQVCREYGALFVDISGMVDSQTVTDHIHPNQSGHDFIVTQFKKVFGQ